MPDAAHPAAHPPHPAPRARSKVVRKSIARVLTVINQQKKDHLRTFYKDKDLVPLDLRKKQTRALRRALTKKELSIKTTKAMKKELCAQRFEPLARRKPELLSLAGWMSVTCSVVTPLASAAQRRGTCATSPLFSRPVPFSLAGTTRSASSRSRPKLVTVLARCMVRPRAATAKRSVVLVSS